MPGSRPKPTNLKLLAGNPGKRRLNSHEAKPTSPAVCPQWLTGHAKTEWVRLAPELEGLGLLSNIDVTGLAAYCESFSRWREAQDKLEAEGQVLTASNGAQYASPWIGIANGSMDRMRQFLIEFGMTPSARSKVVIARKPTPEESRWAQFLDGAH